jgi:glucose-6-phosphate 1-epimerase
MSGPNDIAHLKQRFEREGIAVEVGNGGLTKIVVRNSSCHGEVYLQGAHVTEWRPNLADPVLFVSSRSAWEKGKAIRGGIPLCFPWFGPPTPPQTGDQHGFARNLEWTLAAVRNGSGKTATSLVFELESDDYTRSIWPFDFQATYTVTFGRTLGLAFEVTNTSDVAFTISEALHTYFAVGDVRLVRVEGLADVEYLSKVEGNVRVRQAPGPITLTGETDRVYVNTPGEVRVVDPTLGRVLINSKHDSNTTVVWNPWEVKSVSGTGLSPSEWLRMLCIETANSHENSVKLAPGHKHAMHCSIEVEKHS